MRVLPATGAAELSLAGALAVVAGSVFSQASVVAWGAAIVIGVALTRAAAALKLYQVRCSGLELSWRVVERVTSTVVSRSFELHAELCNRDTRPVHFHGLRAVAASQLELSVEPASGTVEPHSKLLVTVRGISNRVGQLGFWGLALELRGEAGLFEVPLTFCTPIGVSVTPAFAVRDTGRALTAQRSAERGATRSGRRSSGRGDFAELRDYSAGDSLRSVAWKASARRGRLLTRQYESQQRSRVYLVLDASVELWAGPVGRAPLDVVVSRVAQMLSYWVAQGSEVGLAIVHGDQVQLKKARAGRGHAVLLRRALAAVPGTCGPERSALKGIALTDAVLEHLRIGSFRFERVNPRHDALAVAAACRRQIVSAPFYNPAVALPTSNEEVMHAYLAAMGYGGPPSLVRQSPSTQRSLAQLLRSLARERSSPSQIYIASPLPDETVAAELPSAVRLCQRRKVEVRWMHSVEPVQLEGSGAGIRAAEVAAEMAMAVRVAAGEHELRKWGVQSIEGLRAPSQEIV